MAEKVIQQKTQVEVLEDRLKKVKGSNIRFVTDSDYFKGKKHYVVSVPNVDPKKQINIQSTVTAILQKELSYGPAEARYDPETKDLEVRYQPAELECKDKKKRTSTPGPSPYQTRTLDQELRLGHD